MGTLIVRAIALVAFPIIVFVGVGYLMGRLSDHGQVAQQLLKKFKDEEEKKRKPLGLRPFGYNLEAVTAYWGALDGKAKEAERLNLELDLVFPFIYGAAFAGSLLCAWVALGRPFHPVWILTPLFVEVVADWIENLIQLKQLKLFTSNQALQTSWIQVASVATIFKYWLFLFSLALVVGLAVWMVYKNWPGAPAR
ncbi:MAG: hypothetical protein AABM67_01070 [Acidobacteriota bacterium]